MKTQILNLGKGLSKAEQKLINGGADIEDGHPCSGNHHMFKGCLCLRSTPENCASGICNGSGALGICA